MDYELEKLKRRKLMELQKRMTPPPGKEGGEKHEAKELLTRFFVGRAWEVYRAAWRQYPEVMPKIERALVSAIKAGRVRNKIDGESLYFFFRNIGLRVRLRTTIRIKEHGELKTLQDKLRET
jgi:DNA-binding TFAR19-related protein (PDSD5 family)